MSNSLFLRVGALAGAALLVVSLAGPAHGRDERAAPRLDPELLRQLDGATADQPLLFFAHGRTIDAATKAVRADGLRVVDTFDKVGVAVAVGTPRQIRSLALSRDLTYLEADKPIELMLDTSNKATRGEELYAGYNATYEEEQPPICTRPKKKRGKKRPKERCTEQPPITGTKTVQADGSGVTVAVVDSGIDGTHPMFQQDGASKVVRNLKLACTQGFLLLAPDTEDETELPPSTCPKDYGAGSNPWIDMTDAGNDTDTPSLGGHGTHVAGIVGGVPVTTVDGRSMHGAAPGAKLVGLSIGQTLSIYGGAAGLDWVLDNHAAPCGEGVDATACPPIRVVNNSWGLSTDFHEEDAIAKIQRALIAEGVTVVWAAGNAGGDGTENMVTRYAQDPTPGVLAVANYDDGNSGTRDGGLNSTSSRGENGRPETYPDLSAPGSDITSACRPQLAVCGTGFDTADPDYNTIGGTSMAAPHVAGIVAQLVELYSDVTPHAVENVLEDTAYEFVFGDEYDETDGTNPDGKTSFDKGHGLVDAVEASAALLGYIPEHRTPAPPPPPPPLPPGPQSAATYYLHHKGGCANGADPGPFMDLTNSDGDDDFCGAIGTPGLFGSEIGSATIGLLFEAEQYPASVGAPGPLSAGSHVSGTIYLRSNQPAPIDVTVSLYRKGSVIGRATSQRYLSTGPGDRLNDSGALPVEFEFVTRGDIAEGDPLALGVALGTTAWWSFGYEGNHASNFTIDPNPEFATLAKGGDHEWSGGPVTDAGLAATFFGPVCADGASGDVCDDEYIDVTVPEGGGTLSATLTATNPDVNDFDLFLIGPDGAVKDSAANGGTGDETVSATVRRSGVYTIRVRTYASFAGTWEATATLR